MVAINPAGELEPRNLVLRSLRPQAQEFIAQRATTRPIHAGEILYEDGAPFTHAVFPHEGVLSLMAVQKDGRSVEKASIGLEGFLGFVLLLGGGPAVSRSVVQVPGYASWLSVEDLDAALGEFVCVQNSMFRFAKYFIAELMESVACNSLHTSEQRVARWLLHAHDRVQGEVIMVTQQAISDALGLRRATVNEAFCNFQAAGIIDHSRGSLIISDPSALEARACGCYRRIRRNSFLEEGQSRLDGPRS